jgi:pilus assembly protein CpaF
MLQAMNTGHDGSLTTLHANSSRDALSRLETMVLMAGVDLPLRAIREQIAGAVNIIVQTNRLADGSRKILEVVEVTGLEDTTIQTQTIYRFEKKWIGEDGTVVGEIAPTGIVPQFIKQMPGNLAEKVANLFTNEVRTP